MSSRNPARNVVAARLGGHHLDGELWYLAEPRRTVDQDGELQPAVTQQIQSVLDAGHGTVAGYGNVLVVYGPWLRRHVARQAAANWGDQVRHPEPAVTLLFG
jgi:hypothetical protein